MASIHRDHTINRTDYACTSQMHVHCVHAHVLYSRLQLIALRSCASKILPQGQFNAAKKLGILRSRGRRAGSHFQRCKAVVEQKSKITHFPSTINTQDHDSTSARSNGDPSTEVLPLPSASLLYPCGRCNQEVLDHHHAVACDHCSAWFHCACMGISDKRYRNLCEDSKLPWQCGCDSQNVSSSAPTSVSIVNSSNLFDTLRTPDRSGTVYSTNSPVPHCNDRPIHTSTPSKSKPSRNMEKKKLLGLQINCNGLKGENSKLKFGAAVTQHQPDIIFGCESKLDDSIPTYSVFSEKYEVYRKDRSAHGGGVFLAVRNDIIVLERPEFDSDSEVIWASVQFANGCVYIGSFYRPPNATNIILDRVQDSLSKILSKHKNLPNIILAGDWNFPDIDWKNMETTNMQTQAQHNRFLTFLNENGLVQLTKGITRPRSGSILDLVLTSNPEIVDNVRVTII